jgi:hypothetical protein
MCEGKESHHGLKTRRGSGDFTRLSIEDHNPTGHRTVLSQSPIKGKDHSDQREKLNLPAHSGLTVKLAFESLCVPQNLFVRRPRIFYSML